MDRRARRRRHRAAGLPPPHDLRLRFLALILFSVGLGLTVLFLLAFILGAHHH